MRSCVILTIATACAGSAAPQPVAVTANPTAPSEPACADVGVILRGEVNADDAAAGPARERAIQASCETEHWAPDVIRCVTSSTHPDDCLQRLSDTQHAGYTARLHEWSEKFGVPLADTPQPEPELTCEEGLHNSDSIRPLIDDNSPERVWQSELRHRELVASCERTRWNQVTLQCLAIAATPDTTDACLKAELDPAVLDTMYKRYDDVATAAKSIAALRQTPAKNDCKHVVDAHYADAKWHGKGKPEERKQSRSQLLAACTNERWTESRRACMIADPRFCIMDLRWEYPSLPTACGEYQVAIDRVGACTTLPAQTRDALKQAFDSARLGWSNQSNSLEAACRAGADAVMAVLKSASC